MRRMKSEPISSDISNGPLSEEAPVGGSSPRAESRDSAQVTPGVETQLPPDILTVTWGKELFSPRQFHTFEVGPFSMTVAVKPGQTRSDAFSEAYALLDLIAKEERERKRVAYMAALSSMSSK